MRIHRWQWRGALNFRERLAGESALVLGAGALGSPAALALAASGVGRIGLVDDDLVDLSNLARQILHRTADIGLSKVVSGAERLSQLAPSVKVDTYPIRLGADKASGIVSRYGVVIDGGDNFRTKLMLNDACVRGGRPLVTGGILRFNGQLMTVVPGCTPCYRCVFGGRDSEEDGPSCGEAGVFGAVAGLIGMAQAGEAIRILSGLRPAWAGRLLMADLWRGKFDAIDLNREPDCPVCQKAVSGLGPAARPDCPEDSETAGNESMARGTV
ncbi:MAG TPA: adenylyltransferase [Nitrospinae bacterium]|nr:adenylyltransferase [Nitrospinota bacterium]